MPSSECILTGPLKLRTRELNFLSLKKTCRIRDSNPYPHDVRPERYLSSTVSLRHFLLQLRILCREHLVPPVPRHGGVWAMARSSLPILICFSKSFDELIRRPNLISSSPKSLGQNPLLLDKWLAH